MHPQPCRSMNREQACASTTAAVRFTSMASTMSRVRVVGRMPSIATPALFTRTSIRPNRSPTSFTKARNAS